MKPSIPDPVAAAHALQNVIPKMCAAIATELQQVNDVEKKLPEWIEQQMNVLIRGVLTYSADLLINYQNRRIDTSAYSLRNLTEIAI
jgi:hypothetical protein